MPTEKSAGPVTAGTPLAELSCCALMGTVVRADSATGAVVATGGDAEFGRIAKGLGQGQPETEFQAGLRKFASAPMALAAVGITAIGAVLPYTGHLARPLGFRPLPATFFFALAGIVAVYLALVETGKYWFYRYYHAPATPRVPGAPLDAKHGTSAPTETAPAVHPWHEELAPRDPARKPRPAEGQGRTWAVMQEIPIEADKEAKTMASTSRQEEFLAVIRKSQEAVIAVIRNLAETVRTADLPKPPSVSVPFAGKLPGPEDAVVRTYDFAEQLLASQRKFAEDLLKAKPEGAVASTYDFAEQLLASQRTFAEELLKAAAPPAHGHAESAPAAETYKPGQVVPPRRYRRMRAAPRRPGPRQSRYPVRTVLSSPRA